MAFWKNKRSLVWLGGLLAGLGFLGIGLVQGQFSVIWTKAARICLECIGIG